MPQQFGSCSPSRLRSCLPRIRRRPAAPLPEFPPPSTPRRAGPPQPGLRRPAAAPPPPRPPPAWEGPSGARPVVPPARSRVLGTGASRPGLGSAARAGGAAIRALCVPLPVAPPAAGTVPAAGATHRKLTRDIAGGPFLAFVTVDPVQIRPNRVIRVSGSRRFACVRSVQFSLRLSLCSPWLCLTG